ncbi:Uncharacterised protein [Mycobacteroides abscessus subsp. abscessus]|nr:Uncharacterised protein [Mycobacteroides abscessus subsp. abscessus]
MGVEDAGFGGAVGVGPEGFAQVVTFGGVLVGSAVEQVGAGAPSGPGGQHLLLDRGRGSVFAV